MIKRKKAQGLLDTGFFILIIIIFCLWLLFSHTPTEKECSLIVKETPIYSLDLNNQVSGSFFIGIGGFGTNTYYYYFKQAEDGGKILDKRNAEYIRIVEDNTKFPAIVRYYGPNNIKCKAVDIPRDMLRVPEGTIKGKYDIDLGKV